MVELRKTKELNDRLDLEIRALRSRVRSLDAEKISLQQTVVSLQEEVEQLESGLQEQQAEQQLLAVQVQADQANGLAKSQAAELAQSNQTCKNLQEELAAQMRCLLEKEESVVSLQREVELLESVLQEQQQLLTVHAQANQANVSAKSNEICRDLQNQLSAQSRCLLEKESEIRSLKQQLDSSHKDMDNLIATICMKENNIQDQKPWKQKHADSQCCENTHGLKDSTATEDKEVQTQVQLLQNMEDTLYMKCPDYQEAVNAQQTQDKCETFKKEICETLKCLDKERSKYHQMKEKHKAKLCRAKQKLDGETTWRDEKIKNLERELSLCSHSLAKEKELTLSITVENDKLLVERRRLLQKLNEEEQNKKDSHLTAALSKCRVDFLEMENKKLGNKILHMSNQLAVLERSLQNVQSLHFAEELKKISNPIQVFSALPRVPTSSVTMPEPSEIQGILDKTQSKKADVTSSPHCLISGSRSAEMGYLNLTSAQSRSDHSAPPAALSSSDRTCS